MCLLSLPPSHAPCPMSLPHAAGGDPCGPWPRGDAVALLQYAASATEE